MNPDCLTQPCANVKLASPVYCYVDVLQTWLKHPLSRKEWAWVNGQVSHPLLGFPFNIRRGRKQRVRLLQPSEACLHFFAERDDLESNHAEIALDIITPHAAQLKRTTGVGFLQRWHRTKQRMFFLPGDNFRTDDLGRPGTSFQGYDDKPSKVTGELPCFHFEAKINGVRALRRLGINSIADLLAFDHAQFWQRHFIIAEIDMVKLGRYHANRRDGSRRRAPCITGSKSGWLFNSDAAAGHVLWRVFASEDGAPYTLQCFLKRYAQHCSTHSYVIACQTTHSVTHTVLHQLGILAAPDISLLKPELCYALRPSPNSASVMALFPRQRFC